MKKYRPGQAIFVAFGLLLLGACAQPRTGLNYDGPKTEKGLTLNKLVSDMAD